MRKLLFSSLVLLTLHAFGQDAPTQPEMPTFIVPMQLGVDTLKNGIDTVIMSEDVVSAMNEDMVSPNYTIMITPTGDCGQVNLIKSTLYYFIVKLQNGSTPKGVFNYIVYARLRKPMMIVHPNPPGTQHVPPLPPGQTMPVPPQQQQ